MFFSLLVILLIAFKLLGIISVSWWLILLPVYFFPIMLVILAILTALGDLKDV